MIVTEGKSVFDDRGNLKFVNDFDFSNVKRFYLVENNENGFIRAFHGHKKEAKYVFVVSGCIKLVTAKIIDELHLDKDSLRTVFLSSEKPSVVYIPEGYSNGFQTLQEGTKVMFFSTSTLEESKGDDYRLPWDYFGKELWLRTDYR